MAVHARFRAADGIIVASPEYNGHVSPYLKNTVDLGVADERIDARYVDASPFRGKPLLLASASTGWSGGVLGLRDARSLFAYLGCLVSADQICVSDAAQWAADGGFRFDPGFAAYIDHALADFVALVGKLAAAADNATREGRRVSYA